MKKALALLMAAATLFALASCSKKEAPAAGSSQSSVSAAESAQESSFTGILEEKKDFMVVVTAETEEGESGESFLFTLAEGVTCQPAVGDRVTVTYTGDSSAPQADRELTATEITAAE